MPKKVDMMDPPAMVTEPISFILLNIVHARPSLNPETTPAYAPVMPKKNPCNIPTVDMAPYNIRNAESGIMLPIGDPTAANKEKGLKAKMGCAASVKAIERYLIPKLNPCTPDSSPANTERANTSAFHHSQTMHNIGRAAWKAETRALLYGLSPRLLYGFFHAELHTSHFRLFRIPFCRLSWDCQWPRHDRCTYRCSCKITECDPSETVRWNIKAWHTMLPVHLQGATKESSPSQSSAQQIRHCSEIDLQWSPCPCSLCNIGVFVRASVASAIFQCFILIQFF